MTEPFRTLLPPNATRLEHSVEREMARAVDLPVRVRDLWSPDDCPLSLLPWLAWSYGVTQWDSRWTEEQKRNVVRNALFIKRYKGTYAAVERALAALGHSIRIIEWWQETPKADPYTFRIDVQIVDIGIDEPMYDKIERVIADAKNLRSHLTNMRLMARADALVSLGAAVSMGEVVVVDAMPSPDLSTAGVLVIQTGSLQEINLYSRP